MKVAKQVVMVVALVLTPGGISSPRAQVPDEFRNLKVLRRDIGKDALVQIMRDYTGALGVRCTFCHVGEERKPLNTYDFASDEKKPKQVARDMIRMVRTINGKSLEKIDTGHPDRRAVECATCHHGLSRPENLETTIAAVADKDGIDAALAKYRELRDKYYGGDQYDFTHRSLNALAERLAGGGKLADAVKVQQLNIELNPREPYPNQALGMLYKKMGNRDEAIAAFRKAVELDPKNQFAAKQLQELEAAKP